MNPNDDFLYKNKLEQNILESRRKMWKLNGAFRDLINTFAIRLVGL